ncbi:MAG: DUF455 family protein [Proteobacteria bacterium]|nr:DUF455 family protein [Pseudomonadota bacterium]
MESGESLLHEILLGGTLEHKLLGANLSHDAVSLEWSGAPIGIIEAPGRDGVLRPGGEGDRALPKRIELLKDPRSRGRLLHFFANHELLAIETMAYVLLRFPEADPAFKKGVFRILQEEQRHLAKYRDRMQEYGVEFGEVPLNLYFWNTLKTIRTPLDFVARMSLTFEQANLDFALEYATLFENEMDDPGTAGILRLVHDEEIRHVEHGWKWFKQWRDPAARSDFDAYRDALPFPMSPRRARGATLFAGESRLKAGLSSEYIEAVRITGGSRGRVPDYYFFNPGCELESSMPTLPRGLREKIEDLESLMIFLAREEDCVELSRRPDAAFLSELHCIRGDLPELVKPDEDLSRFQAFDRFQPWGWSKSAWGRLDGLGIQPRKPPRFDREVHATKLYSKAFWKQVLGSPGAVVCSAADFQAVREDVQAEFDGSSLLVKSALGTSGRGHLRLAPGMLGENSVSEKLLRRMASGETLVIEPFYEKMADFSVQYERTPEGRLLEFEPRFFRVDGFFQYQGAFLGRSGHGAEQDGLWALIQREKESWRTVHGKVAVELERTGYEGPFGIDCMVVRSPVGPVVIPVIEVNVRYTMGRVAHGVESACRKKGGFRNGVWRFFSGSDLVQNGARDFRELDRTFRERFGGNYFPTTSPVQSKSTFTAVFMNEAAKGILDQAEGPSGFRAT